MNERRTFFARLASISAALWAGRNAEAQQSKDPHAGHAAAAAPQPAKAPADKAVQGITLPASDPHAAHRAGTNLPVEMPDLPKLPFKMVDGFKEFHLIAEVVETQLMPAAR